MGAYKDKLNTEERWQVIHYIRSLQAKDKKLEYNQFVNTLNSVDRPAGEIVAEVMEEDHHHDGDHHDDHDGEAHSHDDHSGEDHHDHDHEETH